MIENIDEDELLLMECLSNPISASECIFNDIADLTHSFDNLNLGHVRYPQIPMLSFEHMIDYDNLSFKEKDKFKLRENLGTIDCFAGRNIGKCSSVDSIILLKDGLKARIGDLINKKETVISFNEHTLKYEESIASFYDNGLRDCYKITTESGKITTVTKNHPLLTLYGWKQVCRLKVENLIATFNGLDKDIVWEKITEIKEIKRVATVAVTVPQNENYVADDIISHNTHCIEVLDILLCVPWLDNVEAGFSSADAIHIRAILEEKLIPILEKHPFYDMYLKGINRSPNYKIAFKNGFTIIGINQNVFSSNPGKNFYGKHLKRLYLEENSLETEEVYNKRLESKSDIGCVIRAAGMTDMTRFSPAGRRFYDPSNQAWVCNLPIYANPNWDENEKKKSIQKYGGEHSIFYRIFCKAEIVEDAITVIDMERMKGCYIEDKIIKQFEINKKNYYNFENIIIVDRYKEIDEVWLSADIGYTTAPSEIMIFFKKANGVFKYEYRITLYGLTDKEQFKIFCYLINKLKANCIAIDATDQGARAIVRQLNEIYPNENIIPVSFGEKIIVDFERDADGRPVFNEKGEIVYIEEYVSEWSIKMIKDILYESKISMPTDYTFSKQLNGLISFKSGNRIVYEVKTGEDHVLAAFRVFGIAYFSNEFKKLTEMVNKKKIFKGIV
ncbi:MAG: Hint domain-containing protein [Candidatus Margulisiibacteriota bacterium]|jgi:hypothetical protein